MFHDVRIEEQDTDWMNYTRLSSHVFKASKYYVCERTITGRGGRICAFNY